MTYNILILGASYGSLLGTKLIMAGHNVSLVCRSATASLINEAGTEVRIKLKGAEQHHAIHSLDQQGKLNALTPEEVDPTAYDLVGLAMQEPQYSDPSLKDLMSRIANAQIPCLSIMNMPPLCFLKRLPGMGTNDLAASYSSPEIWQAFEPGLITLCSPDPQAFRPPDEPGNVLHVGLPTNFKAAPFAAADHNAMLHSLAQDIDAVRLEDQDVPVKLRVSASLFVPLAKWSMLLTGNYRCIMSDHVRPIRNAVHDDISKSREIYNSVNDLIVQLGGTASDAVPFEKYARAAESLLKPSSVARAIDAGAVEIERVDKLVQLIGLKHGLVDASIEETVAIVDQRLAENQSI